MDYDADADSGRAASNWFTSAVHKWSVQRFQNFLVAPVNVAPEPHLLVQLNLCRPVSQHNLYRGLQIDRSGFTAVNQGHQLFQAVVLLALEQQAGKFKGILYSYASVAECALWLLEQATGWRIMQIHMMLIGKDELDPSKGVVGSGLLAKYVWRDATTKLGPVYIGWIDLVSRRIKDAEIIRLRIRRRP